MTAHSPGPWHVSRYIERVVSSGPVVIRDSLDEVIATIDNLDTGADARLIAAAPDGLEAAMFAYLVLLQLSPTSSLLRAANQQTYCKLRDFIAKASGVDAEKVQTEFEARALKISQRLE
jgi:hypothetical protein